jgi:hypothetical protein
VKRVRPRQGAATGPLLWLFAGVSWLGVAGCLEADLPSVVSRGSAGADAATQAMPPIRASESSFGDGQITLEIADASPPAASESGEIALTIGLPIDTSTGKVASVGSLNVRLCSDGLAPRSLTLQLGHPTGEINLSLVNIAAGGPYTLEVMATANGGVACAGSSPPFFVLALQTVRVLESVICSGDAGFASTL